jgi:circadian clock protein KaiC
VARTKTGIPELDEMLRGGFLDGDAVLVAGSAGTGKTTLALEYLVNGIERFGERGVYVSFEQLPSQIYRDALSFGWDLRRMEEEDKLRMVCTSPSLMLPSEGDDILIADVLKEIQPHRLVVDSLSHLAMYVNGDSLRRELYRLIMMLKARGLSTLLTWEIGDNQTSPIAISDVGASFLVDAVVLLKQVEIESAVRRAMVVLKMRGSDHDKRLREYEITTQGFNVGAPFSQYEGVLTGSPRKSLREQAADSWASAFSKKQKTGT